jgi:hypothetical protein
MSGVRCLAVLPLPLTATMMTTTTVPYAFMLSPSVIVKTYFEKPFLTHDIGILIRSLCLLSCHSLTLSTHIQTFVTVQRVKLVPVKNAASDSQIEDCFIQ